ncbi:PREDICTED: chromatin assembly factor 1 subunit A isoform X1 [Capra hircus]|uniref:chromatin assembly factor 1 subunit A isoform X1 n=1 Tax=Capra hircus TaxID=9925 RepID=UPI00084723C7|nr:PREDICTED: chromatin assembly factor 1 subunit A isoform X1 [Capra hircus]
MEGMEASVLAMMLPALPSSRVGPSRDAASPNRRVGRGGRRGSRQIRARRPRQQRRGREGEQQRPPERSPLLRCLRGTRDVASAMLEEPECGAPGARGEAAAMDCKDRPAFPVKKLIQARLPFKRLNLVPKEKIDDGLDDTGVSRGGPVQTQVHDLETSLDHLENCHVGSDIDFRPKLVNGKGPLDNFLRSQVETSIGQAVVIIDLTEDSSNPQDNMVGHSKLNSAASPAQKNINGVPDKAGDDRGLPKANQKDELASPEEALSDVLCKTEAGDDDSGGVDRRGLAQRGSPQNSPKLTGGLSTCSEKDRDGWREAGGILFKGKMPVVVLQDILAPRPPARSPPATPPGQAVPSESETPESSPEEDLALSHSSLSSSSPTSSPEGQSVPTKLHTGPSPLPASTPICRITKKLVRGSAEKNKMKLQRDKERLRRQLKLRAEKEEKEKLREEAKRAKEEARKKREEEKELKEKERREKREKDEKEKAEKQRLKEERRKERQEALEAKLEEKRKKEEEKRLREEEKRIKAEKAEITRFFQKPKTPQAPKTLAGSCGKFAPFEIKEHMVLAPRCRTAFDQDLCDQLDQLLQQQSSEFSFLQDLKRRRPLRSGPTVVSNRNTNLSNSDVVIVESSKVDGVPERRKFGRMKLLQFSENHRPAYWGTWNKQTTVIRPRDPWAQDRDLLDYEVDSDEEWEEEEPGESLSHSEGDEDDDVGEDEDEDDGFFVPHGYLSEDEGVTEECADPENHKVRQKLKAKEWDEFLAKGKRFRILQPVKIGCIWAADKDGGADLKVLQQFTACLLETVPPEEEQTPKASKREKRDQQILAQLLPLLHGNVNGSKVIIREFQECCRRGLLSRDAGSPEHSAASPPSPGPARPQTPTTGEDMAVPSKARLKRIISENSVYEKRPDFRMCWYVHPQVLKSFAQEHLPVPCQWSYVTAVPSATKEDSGSVPVPGPGQGMPVSLKRKSAGSMCITQFMKKRRHDGQVGTGDLDGFQADTEEEDDEEGDCVIMDISDVGGFPCPGGSSVEPDGQGCRSTQDQDIQAPCGTTSGAGGSVGMDTSETLVAPSSLGLS